MLQVIRDKAQGWIAWAIVILISIPFALWGIQSYLGVGSEPIAATVNGAEINERTLDNQYQRFRQQLREQLGAAYRPEMFDDARMRKEVLNRLIRDELVQQTSNRMGLRAGSNMIQASILSMPTFQKDGRYDQQTYERALRLQGLSPAGFEDRVRRALVAEQLSQAVNAGSFVTPKELNESQRLLKQTRELSYFVVPASDFKLSDELSDDEIKAYYEANQSAFISPEKVKVEYILLDAGTAGGTIEVDEERLRGYYENNQDEFGLPEQRQASHILILAAADADQSTVDEAKAKIDALAERVRNGESFEELAKQNSQDPGSAASGGDLGFFGKGIMDPAFESAVYALQEGGVSEPVRTSFGFHLIKLTGIKDGTVKPFEEARTEIEAAYRKFEGERLYFELAEQLADLSYEDPGSLESPASVLELSIQQSDWITREQGAGVFANLKVRTAAYSDDVLKEHNNSELIEIDGTSSLVLRVLDHQESSVLPLDEVKQQITETLQQQKAEQQAQAEAEKRMAEMAAGAPLSDVAESYAVTGPMTVDRNDRQIPPGLSSALFRTVKPAAGGSSPGTARLAGGDFAVYLLTGVTEGSADDKSNLQQQESLRRMLGRDHYEMVLTDLESRADIEILLNTDSE
ncbi:MAG: SurA N-terminal domain-containing protein [Candidatus Thiodiazotropha endolucinida]|nr:SurA N-terminal domain-containing protein [Candidatus Thiodiazotropha taylori]MCG8093333.1 SurA N-terminal domain-containing protein [Candidatus Thiodiazotropha endolucinida]MCG8061357.1 SurA N-terminal domain-containing protein [Candidatus Thiodiazotropha taylori]MCG8064713.1 SurA N-terminal domain-containing protein [Candidatus Thiodiazotropha taylori]MCW4330803.1 SurA N-terminal domain-containing protein [Candidatus Thiodiazotropha endolucinida]